MKMFLSLNLSDVVFIMLINVKMPTIVGILKFMYSAELSMNKVYNLGTRSKLKNPLRHPQQVDCKSRKDTKSYNTRKRLHANPKSPHLMGAGVAMNKQQQNHCLSTDSGRCIGGSRGGDPPPPDRKSQKYRVFIDILVQIS